MHILLHACYFPDTSHEYTQVKHFLGNLLKPAVTKNSNIEGNVELLEASEELYQDCMDTKNDNIGQYRKRTAANLKSMTQELWQGSALRKNLNAEKVKNILGKINTMIEDKKGKENVTSMILSHLSQNLADAELPSAGEGAMCVPGQHFTPRLDGLSGESAFVKIVSCDPKLKVFSSVTRPKLLKLRGSDGKEYWWVVKGGEDVRQDERIQQAFRCMNNILAADVQCAQRRLAIATYNVIPLSKLVGMIECVRDTASLGEVIEKNDTSEIAKLRKAQNKCVVVKTDYIPGIQQARKPESKMLNDFDSIQNEIPEDLLRRGLMGKAQTAQVRLHMQVLQEDFGCCR
jgi:phosphatidylinositol kinase/protein kinase (PI-3  family)